MSETLVEIRVPDPLLRLGLNREEVEKRTIEWLVLSLFAEARISSGKAARLLDMSRVGFLALLRQRGIAYLNYDERELAEEFAAVEDLQINQTP